ncbi:MAG TPA: NTP/NDP exchange transporter [Amoebophilaceae bacterium]|jgi:ATP/ADP translocase|nr:NTP/NDP exchange transporter [Amoebophilaceae bacterium]
MEQQINMTLESQSPPPKKWLFATISKKEWPKFCSMAALMFLILLTQNLIRGVKDSLVVTSIGAEVLSFIKLFVEMPMGMLFVLLYAILCNKMTTEQVFRYILLIFMLFFLLFGLVLFPYQTWLHPHPDTVSAYTQAYPHLKWFFAMWSKWTLVLFYMMGELWPMIVFTLLYWQLANKCTTTEEASRFYFLFSLVGQSNLLLSGAIMVYFMQSEPFLVHMYAFLGMQGSMETLQIGSLMLTIVVLCSLILVVHRYIEVRIVPTQMASAKTTQTAHLKLGVWESLRTIAQSNYLGCIFVLMFSYSMVLNLIEGLWFHETSLFYQKDTACFISYQGRVLFWTGICALTGSLVGHSVIQKIGWKGTALLTPRVTLAIGGCFFVLVVGHSLHMLPQKLFGITPLALIVTLGGLQNILAKGTKYCFFDVTKEMAYIPLDDEMCTKGKAAVDILGGKVGKSSGAILQVICYTLLSNVRPDQLAPLLMVLFSIICYMWIKATKKLGNQYDAQQQKIKNLQLQTHHSAVV